MTICDHESAQIDATESCAWFLNPWFKDEYSRPKTVFLIDELASVTLSWADWWELMDCVQENIASALRRPHVDRMVAEWMLPYLRAYTQLKTGMQERQLPFADSFHCGYDDIIKDFDPSMCEETRQRYYDDFDSGAILPIKRPSKREARREALRKDK